MGLFDKLSDEVIDKIFSLVKSQMDDRKKADKFIVVWNDVRDEYESNYGRDELYHRMWANNKMVGKLMLDYLRKSPASREFISRVFSFTREIMKDDFSIDTSKNFASILFEHLLYCEEFSDKIVKIRQDYENGQQFKIMQKDLQQIDELGKAHFIEKSEQLIINETVIDLFSNNFTRVMFMQKKYEAQIQLKDIYVENDYKFQLGKGGSASLISFIYQFCSKMNNSPILFIEGHAGIGKSSLVSQMAYDYKNRRSIWKDKKLAIIQLRNLVKNSQELDINNPWADFKRYLRFNGSMRKMLSILDEYVLILDGFDELCLIDNIRLNHKLIYVANIVNVLEDYQCNCKIIVTTRPNYLAKRDEWKMVYQNPIVIHLEHFYLDKRKEWLRKAKEAGMKISEKVEKSLTSILQKDIEVVASTPFTLYLIAHENIELSENDALWSVYMKIFGEEVIRKRYDRLNEHDEINSHPGNVISKIIFAITKEIAYYMFCSNKMDIDWEEIGQCIDKVVQNEMIEHQNIKIDNSDNLKNLLKDSYALFSYYSETELGGGISFYHNYIREFFVQEKIHEELKKIYLDGLKKRNKERTELTYIKERLCELLKKGRLSDKTIDFLISYEMVNKDKGTWSDLENRFHFMKDIFTDILIDLGNEYYNENIILNFWGLLNVINSVCKEYSDSKEKIYYEMFNKEKISNSNGKNNIEYYFELISKALDIEKINLKGINLRGKILQNMNFNKCDLRGIVLSGAYMANIKFINCDLSGCDFRGATLENVQFEQCKIEGGKLRGIEMNNGELVNCTMGQCQLQGSRIIRTIIEKTDIENSQLNAVEFMQAEIRDVERIWEHISNFEYANMENLKWITNLDKKKYYDCLNELKHNEDIKS